jgi:TPR repeat protein
MVQLASMNDTDEARHWLRRACEIGYAPAMLHYADFLMQRDPVEALSWLYAGVALSGHDAARKRAAALAREMSASEIDTAQKAGRLYAKEIRTRVRETR